MSIENIKDEKLNYGLALLRIWMCFEVVCCHYWKGDISKIWNVLNYGRDLAVPCFMLMSFYFLAISVNKQNADSLKHFTAKRLFKIALPQIGWTIIIWIFENICSVFEPDRKQGIGNLIIQLFTGHSYNTAMWFQIDLLVLTLLVIGIYWITKNKNSRVIIFCVLLLVAFFLEYSELLYEPISYLRGEIRYPLGRLIEMIPYAMCGLILFESNILNRINNKLILVGSIIYLLAFSIKHITFYFQPQGYNYQGITLFCGALAAFLIFKNLPCDVLTNRIKRIVSVISGCTLGVYCMHISFGRCINYLLNLCGVTQNTLLECFVIFIVGISISMLFINNRNRFIKGLFL